MLLHWKKCPLEFTPKMSMKIHPRWKISMKIHQKCPREFTFRKCPIEFVHLKKSVRENSLSLRSLYWSWMRLVSARNFTVICHYRMILCTIQAIVPWNTMPATLNKSIFKTRSHVLFGLGTISHSRSLLQYLFLLYYESLEEAGCRIHQLLG